MNDRLASALADRCPIERELGQAGNRRAISEPISHY
jgi:hypothetical protein